jgi:NAD(P)-dependent dehydrogenase (short-subunit alcohol dehydrogenase family)
MNAILPGIIDTRGLQSIRPKEEIESTVEQTPVRKMGQPEDVAHAAAFLAAEESGYITGTTLLVDGGSTLL